MNHYMDKIALETFIVIDEFDSFYHYEMTDMLVQYLKREYSCVWCKNI